jgi:cytochrome c553
MKPFLLVVALSLCIAACTDRQAPAPKSADEKPGAGDPVAGKTVADRACKACHGLDGQGTAPGIPNLASQRAAYLVAAFAKHAAGKRPHAALSGMPDRLGDADSRNVAAYYASLAPRGRASAAGAAASSPYEDGKALAFRCSKCHGEDGNALKSGIPSLAGQQPLFLANALRSRHSGGRATPAFAFDSMQSEKLSLYFASQTPALRAPSRAGDANAGSAAAAPCGGCHGVDGVSDDAMTPSLAGQDPAYLAAKLKTYRASRRHGALQRHIAGLSDQDVNDIVAFYAGKQPRAARKGVAEARELTAQCDRCHDAENPAVPAPILRGQDKDYLAIALRGYRDGRRESSTMHQLSSVYGNVLIDSIATWYAGQSMKQGKQ